MKIKYEVRGSYMRSYLDCGVIEEFGRNDNTLIFEIREVREVEYVREWIKVFSVKW